MTPSESAENARVSRLLCAETTGRRGGFCRPPGKTRLVFRQLFRKERAMHCAPNETRARMCKTNVYQRVFAAVRQKTRKVSSSTVSAGSAIQRRLTVVVAGFPEAETTTTCHHGNRKARCPETFLSYVSRKFVCYTRRGKQSETAFSFLRHVSKACARTEPVELDRKLFKSTL